MSAIQDLRDRLRVIDDPGAALRDSEEDWILIPVIDIELVGRVLLEMSDKIDKVVADA